LGEELINAATNPSDFIRLVEEALKEKNKENAVKRRKQLAKENTWESRLDKIEEFIKG
jgi:hypothetical protein